MRKLFILNTIGLLLYTASCSSPENTTENELISVDLIDNPATAEEGKEVDQALPEFEFQEKAIDFGTISQGEKVKRSFYFKNIGDADLIISDASGSCGCTVPIWPRNPIAPGEEEEIEVVFDSNGKSGRVNKTITLTANTIPNTFVIAIRGEVLVPNSHNN